MYAHLLFNIVEDFSHDGRPVSACNSRRIRGQDLTQLHSKLEVSLGFVSKSEANQLQQMLRASQLQGFLQTLHRSRGPATSVVREVSIQKFLKLSSLC